MIGPDLSVWRARANLSVDGPQLAFGNISDVALRVDILDIGEELAVRRGGTYEQCDARMAGHFFIRLERRRRVTEQLPVGGAPVGISHRGAKVPSRGRTGASTQVHRVAVVGAGIGRRVGAEVLARAEVKGEASS